MECNLNLPRAFTVAKDAAVEAGEVLLGFMEAGFTVRKKGLVNLVTEADLKAESLILDRLGREFPGHRILSEEKGAVDGDATCRWVVDPLDGTTNFAHGYPVFCVSIALEAAGRTLLGVVYNPVSREMFTAEQGRGAFLNGKPIRVSESDRLIDSLLCTGFSYDRDETSANLELFNRVTMHAQALRRDGSAALDLCNVACGRFDAFWELSLHPWDVAAGKLLVEEAGGRVTRLDGSTCTIFDPGVLASNSRIHQAMTALLIGG